MKISFSQKLALLILLSCFSIAAIVSGVALYHQSKAVKSGVAEMRKTL